MTRRSRRPEARRRVRRPTPGRPRLDQQSWAYADSVCARTRRFSSFSTRDRMRQDARLTPSGPLDLGIAVPCEPGFAPGPRRGRYLRLIDPAMRLWFHVFEE